MAQQQSSNYPDILSNLIKGGLKLGQLVDLLDTGFTAFGQNVPYAGAIGIPLWAITNLMKGTDVDFTKGPLSGLAAMGALAGGPIGWGIAGLGALGSLIMGGEKDDPMRLHIKGTDTLQWGDEGLTGFEGLVLPTWVGGPSIGPPILRQYIEPWPGLEDVTKKPLQEAASALGYDKPLDFVKDVLKGKYDDVLVLNGPISEYTNYDEYLKASKSPAAPYAKIIQDLLGYPLSPGTAEVSGYGGPDNYENYVLFNSPIVTQEWGPVLDHLDLMAHPEIPFLTASYHNTSQADWMRGNYSALKDAINNLTSSVVSVFNQNVMDYLNTLPEDQRASITAKLAETPFTISYNNPGEEYLNSIEFVGAGHELPDFMSKIAQRIIGQLRTQAKAAGLPENIFEGTMTVEPDTQEPQYQKKEPTMFSSDNEYTKLLQDYLNAYNYLGGKLAEYDAMPGTTITFGGQDTGITIKPYMGTQRDIRGNILNTLANRGNFVSDYAKQLLEAEQRELDRQNALRIADLNRQNALRIAELGVPQDTIASIISAVGTGLGGISKIATAIPWGNIWDKLLSSDSVSSITDMPAITFPNTSDWTDWTDWDLF